jgi:hypothetical protein
MSDKRKDILAAYEGAPVQPTQGPFSVLDAKEYTDLVTVRWSDVAGSVVLVVLDTNITFQIAGATANGWVIAEIRVSGMVAGVRTVLKTSQINRYSGPMLIKVPQDEPYEALIVSGRNFSGGSPGINAGSPVNNASGAKMDILIAMQNRLIGEFAHGKLSKGGQ